MSKDNQNIGWSLIPPKILSHEDLTSSAKLVWGRIKGLEGKHGYCWASNEYIAKNLSLKKGTITKLVKQLIDAGLVKRELIRDDKGEVEERRLWTIGSAHIPESNPSQTNDQEGVSDKDSRPLPDKRSSKGVESSSVRDTRDKDSSSNPKEKYNEYAPLNGNGLDYDKIKDKWNSKVPDKVNIRNMTDNRKDKLRVRFREPDFNLDEIIDEVNKSSFLVDDLNPNLFTWLIKNQDNYTKTLEGSYEDNGQEKVTAANFDQNKDRGFDQW